MRLLNLKISSNSFLFVYFINWTPIKLIHTHYQRQKLKIPQVFKRIIKNFPTKSSWKGLVLSPHKEIWKWRQFHCCNGNCSVISRWIFGEDFEWKKNFIFGILPFPLLWFFKILDFLIFVGVWARYIWRFFLISGSLNAAWV